ncbi:MAG TPA: enoyl-CoA hydratase/isomerase family protein [Syntrophales bacterium]|nr:enoyl-CoA hydratase/isomerase family protein [Syntrophales bacterium]HPQ43636.1 enoyl-CoA hydratase/isomerase family protein [Syntrophales bacterium]
MTYTTVLVDKSDRIATVTLNRPQKLNAMTTIMAKELIQLFDELEADPDVRVIILTGAGKGFCAGGDMQDVLLAGRELDAGKLDQVQTGFCLLAQRMMRVEKPMVAAVNGVAAGAGFCFVLFCDLRVASENAKFGITFVHRGLPATDMGSTWLLPRLVGLSKATEMLLLGEMLTAQELGDLGLLHRVVPSENVHDEAQSLARRLAVLPPLAIKMTKRALLRSYQTDFAAQASYETALQTLAYSTQDLEEGIQSFLEKRDAVFQGK